MTIEGRKFYHFRTDIAVFVDKNWDLFWVRTRPGTWRSLQHCYGSDLYLSAAKLLEGSVESQGLYALVSLDFPGPLEMSRSRYQDLDLEGKIIEGARKDRKRKSAFNFADDTTELNGAAGYKENVEESQVAKRVRGTRKAVSEKVGYIRKCFVDRRNLS